MRNSRGVFLKQEGLGGFTMEDVFGTDEDHVGFQCRQVCNGNSVSLDPDDLSKSIYGEQDTATVTVRLCAMSWPADAFRVR